VSPSHALRSPRGRRRFVAPATAVPALAVPVLLLAGALPAWAQTGSGYGRAGGSAGAVLTSPLTVTLGVVAVVASAVVAGTAALGFLSPPSRRSVLVVQGGATVAVPVLVINCLVGGLAAFAAVPQAAGVLVAALLFARGCQIASAVAGLMLIGALGYNATIGHSGWHVGLAAVHMVAAVTWLGSAVSVATPACGARFTVLRRHTLVFAVAATVAVAAAALEAVAKGMRFDGVTFGSLTGQLLLVQALGMVVAVSTGLCSPGAIGGRVVAVAAGLVFTAGTVIAVQTPAPVPAETGRWWWSRSAPAATSSTSASLGRWSAVFPPRNGPARPAAGRWSISPPARTCSRSRPTGSRSRCVWTSVPILCRPHWWRDSRDRTGPSA
jgi:hypothetical protein